jgi:AhpC/TSA family protein
MRRAWLGFVPALLIVPAAWGLDDPPQKKEPTAESSQAPAATATVAELTAQYAAAMDQFMKAYTAAKSDEEKRELVKTRYPDADQFASQFLEIAANQPKTSEALSALTWVVRFANPTGPKYAKAIKSLASDYGDSPRIKDLLQTLMLRGIPNAEPLFLAVIEKNSDRTIKGYATFGMARLRKSESDRTSGKEAEAATQSAEKYLHEVIDHYADLGNARDPLGELARRDLFEIEHLGIGKPAPEIEGEDIDGKTFKLSDYKGKVVVLDFWGNW